MAISFAQLHLVEPSPEARRLLWHVCSIGRVWRDETEEHPPLDKAGAYLFRVVSGRGSVTAGNHRWDLQAGARCWLLEMGQSRKYEPVGKQRLVTSGFRFAGPGLGAWLEALGGGEFRFPSPKEMAFLSRAQTQLWQLVTRRPAGYEWKAHEIITSVLGRLMAARGVFGASTAAAPAPVKRVLDAVLANPARAWRAAELAGIARVSYSGLRAQFRGTQQEGLHEFLRRTRLDQARLLLADERLTVKEIALSLKFSSEFYFSHWFRRNTSLSPSRFRRSVRD